MPNYKLHYFNGRGRAETARLLFAYAGVEYEDIRISGDQWPERKSEMPYKKIPVLEIDGEKLCQSVAINRFLAREFGLNGKTSFQTAKADEFDDAISDVMMHFPWLEKDEQKKKKLIEIALREKFPPGLAMLEANMTGECYTGNELTYADIGFASAAYLLMQLDSKVLDATPKLKALYERVNAIPNIAKWIEKRPKTAM